MAITLPIAASSRLPARRALFSPLSFGMAALSGVLLILCFPHGDLGWLAWAALVPFLLTFPHATLRAALAHGAVLGCVFFGGLMYWIGLFAAHAVGPVLGSVAWLGSVFALAPWLVIFAGGAHWLSRRGFGVWLWGLPALWTVLEWGRQFGILGTTWGDLAFTQHRILSLLQVTKATGPWGLSFLVVLVNVLLAQLLRGRREIVPKRKAHFAGALAVFALALGSGWHTLNREHLHPAFVAAALQGNINQNVLDTPAYEQRVLDTFAAQSRTAKAQGATLTVWPETAVPGYLRLDPRFAQPIAQSAVLNHQTALVGARGYLFSEKKDTNTLFLVTPQGTIAGEYSKRHLVPFGEYVPLRATFPVLERLHLSVYDMAQGGAHQPLLDAGPPIGKIGAAICYDSTYSGLMRAQVARGANLLVVTTDDTWFGRTAAAGQHAAMASVDAAATDRYLVRCAATGISQVLDPAGRVIASSHLFVPAVVSVPVQSRHTQTFYVRYGDWFVLLSTVLAVFLFLSPARQKAPPA